jgi:hypothetical protein
VSLNTVINGALLGGALGAATGLVPLCIGFACRERRKAIAGFLGCVAGGAVGGLYPSIAIMAGTTAQIVKPQPKSGERTKRGAGLATMADKLWYFVAVSWLIVWMIGLMFISGAFLIPLVLGVPNDTPLDSVGRIVEPVMLFGGMGVGILIGLAGVSFICRRFLSSATHSNWAEEFNASTLHRSPLLAKLAFYYYKFLLPSDWPLRSPSSQM